MVFSEFLFHTFLDISVWSEAFFVKNRINVQNLDVLTVFFEQKFIFSWVVLAANGLQNAVNLKPFPFHLLMVTPTLVVISGFDEV